MISVIRVRLKGHTLFPLVLSGCLGLLSGCANNYPTQVVYTDTAEEGSLVTGIQTTKKAAAAEDRKSVV